MNLTQFIKENRSKIDECILKLNPNQQTFNDSERRLWILNDESLYNWAKSEEVKI